jgi:hypothetical protein
VPQEVNLLGVRLLEHKAYDGRHILFNVVVNRPPAAAAAEQAGLVRHAIACGVITVVTIVIVAVSSMCSSQRVVIAACTGTALSDGWRWGMRLPLLNKLGLSDMPLPAARYNR